MGGNLLVDPSYYQFTRQIRVDPYDSTSDATTIKQAIALANSYSRDLFNRVQIQLNPAVYIQNETWEIPTFTEVVSLSTNTGNIRSGAVILSGLTEPIPQTETHWLKMNSFSGIKGVALFNNRTTPDRTLSDYKFIMVDGSCNMTHVTISSNDGDYNGPFRHYGIYMENDSVLLELDTCELNSQGSSTTGVRVGPGCQFAAYFCKFDADPDIWIDDYTTDPTVKNILVFCQMYNDLLLVNTQAETWVVRHNNAAGRTRLVGTRVALDDRTGGVFQENHPTPQQLETAIRSKSISVAINTTIDGYEDGTILRTAGDLTMPPVAEVVDGQAFVLINDGATTMSVNGNGINIDGSASISVDANERVVIQYVSGVWVVISTAAAGGHSTIKSGVVLSGSFSGSPLTASVVFASAMATTNYSVNISSEVATSSDSFSPVLFNKLTTGFTISLATNDSTGLVAINWQAVE